MIAPCAQRERPSHLRLAYRHLYDNKVPCQTGDTFIRRELMLSGPRHDRLRETLRDNFRVPVGYAACANVMLEGVLPSSVADAERQVVSSLTFPITSLVLFGADETQDLVRMLRLEDHAD